MYLPRIKELRRAYGFEEVAIVPGEVTINPELANTTFSLGPHSFSVPLIASAMDGVVNPDMAIMMHEFGGLGVLNLEGIHGRYEDPGDILEEISHASEDEITPLFQKIYSSPIKDQAIAGCITRIKGRRCGLRRFRNTPEHQEGRTHCRRGRRRHPRSPVDGNYCSTRLPKLQGPHIPGVVPAAFDTRGCRELGRIQYGPGAYGDRHCRPAGGCRARGGLHK